MKKKIAIFNGYFFPHMGGIERYTDKLAVALKKIGYEVIIVTSNHNALKNYEKTNWYTIYRLPILSIAKERYPIPKINSEYRHLLKKIEKEKIDYFIVNTRFHLTSLIGAKLGRRSNKPVVLIEHGTDHFTVNSKFLDFFGHIYEHLLTSIIKKYVDGYYGVSKRCNDWSKHFSIDASGVFYNSINKSDELNVGNKYQKKYPKNEIIITYAGRLIKEKGILNLLEAFKQLLEDNPKKKLKLVIAGDGPLLADIRTKYAHKNIDILGRIDFNDVMALYKRTDIFVYPSLFPEGLPTSILEAGLMKCAVIATPRGGTEEVIINNQHGMIVNGSVASLKRSMTLLINDDNLKQQLADNIYGRVIKHFDWDDVAAQLDKEIGPKES